MIVPSFVVVVIALTAACGDDTPNCEEVAKHLEDLVTPQIYEIYTAEKAHKKELAALSSYSSSERKTRYNASRRHRMSRVSS